MNSFNIVAIEEPTDLVKKSLNKKVFLRCRGDRELTGFLHVLPLKIKNLILFFRLLINILI